jgi:hypothetical protein
MHYVNCLLPLGFGGLRMQVEPMFCLNANLYAMPLICFVGL